MPTQYDNISREYTRLAMNDRFKRYLQYPEALRLAGSLEGSMILDIGSGAGLLTEQLAQKARVIAYDNSREQIAQALANPSHKAQYFVADPHNIEDIIRKNFADIKFDKAISTMVLMYSQDKSELEQFFASTFNLLNDDGAFSSIIYDPEHKITDNQGFQRRWTMKGKKLSVDFLDENGNTITSADFNNYSREDYEDAAKKAGFTIEWMNLVPSKEGIELFGQQYWEQHMKNPAYIGFIARKN